MPTTPLIHALWIAGLLIRLLVLLALMRGRLYRELRAFSIYTLFGASADAWLWFVQRHYAVYFFSYWTSEFLYLALDVVVIGGIYLRLGRNYPAARKAAAGVLCWTLIVFCVLSALAIAARQNSSVVWLVSTLEILLRSARIVQLGALLALFLITHLLSVQMRREDRIVALGYAVITATNVIALALMREFGLRHLVLVNASMMVGTECGMLIWAIGLIRLRRPAPLRPSIPEVPITDWNETLSEMLHK